MASKSTVTLCSWLTGKHSISIAHYQRPYSWSDSHVLSFTSNLISSIEDHSCINSLADIGLVIVEKKGDHEYIADGQQRLLTFLMLYWALFYDPHSSKLYKIGQSKNNRCSQILSSATDIETLTRLIHAREIIRDKLRYTPITGNRDQKYQKLANVSMGLLEFNNTNGKSNNLIINLFEEVNTTGKLLNGGQILKARHLGKVLTIDSDSKSRRESQLEYENWRNNHKKNDKLGLPKFNPRKLGQKKEFISIDSFIDSEGQDAWYNFGYGFVQSVQAILLGQHQWWHSLSEQNNQRLDPFERFDGYPNNLNSQKNLFQWDATNPLNFKEGGDFFRLVGRIGSYYNDYIYCLEKLFSYQSQNNFEGFIDFFEKKISPGILVTLATAKICNFFVECKNRYNPDKKDDPLRPFMSNDQNKNSIPFDNNLTSPLFWLGFSEDHIGTCTTCGGGIPTSLFSVALYWLDKFLLFSNQKEEVSSSKEQVENVKKTIICVIIYQLLCAKKRTRSDSVLSSLGTNNAINAALFSRQISIAWWKLLNSSSPDEWRDNFFKALRQYSEKMPDSNYFNEINQVISSSLLKGMWK